MTLQLIRKMCNKKLYLEFKTRQLKKKKKKSYIFKTGGNCHKIQFQREAVDSPLLNAFQLRMAAFPEGILQVSVIIKLNT